MPRVLAYAILLSPAVLLNAESVALDAAPLQAHTTLEGSCLMQVSRKRSSSNRKHRGHGGCAPPDYTKLDSFLKKFVSAPTMKQGVNSTLLDYQAALSSAEALAELDAFTTALDSADVSGCSQDAKLAFWANTYNALIIQQVLKDAQKQKGMLTASIRDIECKEASKVWNCPAGSVGSKKMTLEGVLSAASKLKDPRIHAAVNCASLSCPDLRAEAYSAEKIDAQLNEQVSTWLQNPTKGAKMIKGNGGTTSLTISPIFQWHSEDFPDLLGFLAGALGLERDAVTVSGHFEYNWVLNSAPS
mmetsp:Transcript_64331/g.112206  ORF Transcript_64331/g.112206 Transcript_64331/m.112206 type:complete len:301 (+) Transcript_64331:119-1021(+)